MMSRRGRGIHRTPRAGPMAVAARATSAAPAGTGCSTASLLSNKAVFASWAIWPDLAGPATFVADLLRRMSLVVALRDISRRPSDTDGMMRLSCGLEHPDDVCEDLLAALDKV